MNKDIQRLVRSAAVDPDLEKKDQFIRQHRRSLQQTQVNCIDMILLQVKYISIPVWIISFLAFFTALWCIHTDKNVLFIVSSVMPFASGIAVYETFRSHYYNMTELEGVTLFSMRGILFARISCIGALHLVLLLALTVLIGKNSGHNFILTGAVITIPYLISSIGSLELERTAFGRKNPLGCILVSAFTSGLIIAAHNHRVLFSEKYETILFLSFAVLTIWIIWEIKTTFGWEKYSWN